MRNKSEQKGITLVALVITIIILLILAGISISALTNTGLFGKAKEAKQKTENAQELENQILSDYEKKIDELLGTDSTGGTGATGGTDSTGGTGGTGTTGGSGFTNVDTTKTNPQAAMPANVTVIEADANKGIVIKDSKNNEWVWVEVPKTTVFTTATSASDYNNIKADLIAYATDYRQGSARQTCSWTDEYYDGCGVADGATYTAMYNKMLSSVYTNGGFWISRYEIGDSTATANNTTRTEESGTIGTAVSQVNQIPYNYVTCGQAQTLASGMSTDSNKTSSLLFGIQWDLVCKFLEENTSLTKADINSDSTSWGNYCNSSLTLNRGMYNIDASDSTSVWTSYTTDTYNYVTNKQTSDNTSYKQLLTTGASEYTNKMNIYDFAGNLYEWTLENTSDTRYPCASRGGVEYFDGSGFPASIRCNESPSSIVYGMAFRSALY